MAKADTSVNLVLFMWSYPILQKHAWPQVFAKLRGGNGPRLEVLLCQALAKLKSTETDMSVPTSRDGGIGRRAGLKIPCPQGCESSILSPGTSLSCDCSFRKTAEAVKASKGFRD